MFALLVWRVRLARRMVVMRRRALMRMAPILGMGWELWVVRRVVVALAARARVRDVRRVMRGHRGMVRVARGVVQLLTRRYQLLGVVER
jgi:hypothetical protein